MVDTKAALADLAALLMRVDQFYDSIGGLVGYQAKSIELILEGSAEQPLPPSPPPPLQQQQQQQQHDHLRHRRQLPAAAAHQMPERLPHVRSYASAVY